MLIYTLQLSNKPSNKEITEVGLINETTLIKHLPENNKDTLIVICGSKPMTRDYLLPMLKKLSYEEQNILILQYLVFSISII